MPFSNVPFIFSPNTLIQSAQVNADFASVVEDGNNIDASQITTGILPVDRGGTGVTTPGEITTSIGAVAKAGDTMTGMLTVPNITYSGFPGHSWAFNWDGTYAHVIVDGIDTGIIGDITNVVAGNGLTGGGSTGPVTLAMSGSYSGNFSATGAVQGAYVYSTGNVTAVNSVTGGYVHSTGDMQVDGTLHINYLFGAAPGSGVAFTSHLFPQTDGGVFCGLSAWAWAGVESYAYYTKTTRALQRDIVPVPPECLSLVNAIEPKTYKLNLEADEGRTHWGFLAPEVGEAMRRAGVTFDGARVESETSNLAYNDLVAVLWGAVRELSARVKTLEAANGAA